MNTDTFFKDTIILAKKTINNELNRYSDMFYNMEVIIDNEKCYRIVIEWKRCMGELLVDRPEFAPYRYVSLNILSTDTINISSVYCWYDSEGDSLEIIKQKIIEGINAGFNY